MSHFAVTVISKNKGDIDALLAPYQQNNMGDCPKEFLEFVDVEPEARKEYETETITKIKTQDGKLLWPWDEEFRVSGTYGRGTNTHKIPDDCEKIEILKKDAYPSFDQFMSEYMGYKIDQETGKYGYWENPNAKWDYWTIGGRWSGIIKDNLGFKADQSRIKDLNFNLDQGKYEYAIRFWEINVEKQKLLPGEEEEEYFCFYTPEYYLNRYKSKEEYATSEAEFSTFALITPDGQWHERGSMGWFGFDDSDRESIQDFRDFFKKTIDTTNPEYFLTIVDCHI